MSSSGVDRSTREGTSAASRRSSRAPSASSYVETTSQTTGMSIVNAGGGTAKGVAFALVAGGMRAEGIVGDGFLRPSEGVRVNAALPRVDEPQCLVMWRTIDESSWAVDRVGPPKRLRKGRPSRWRWWERRSTLDDAWARFQTARAWTRCPRSRRR